MKKIEFIIDEKTGDFVYHASQGFGTHEAEHGELDKILAEVKKLGVEVKSIKSFHDDPKLPEIHENEAAYKERSRE